MDKYIIRRRREAAKPRPIVHARLCAPIEMTHRLVGLVTRIGRRTVVSGMFDTRPSPLPLETELL